MPIFEFTTTFALSAQAETDEVALTDTLYDAGCTDALVGLGGLPDKLVLDFCREAATLDAAVETAIADVKRAIPGCTLLEVADANSQC